MNFEKCSQNIRFHDLKIFLITRDEHWKLFYDHKIFQNKVFYGKQKLLAKILYQVFTIYLLDILLSSYRIRCHISILMDVDTIRW